MMVFCCLFFSLIAEKEEKKVADKSSDVGTILKYSGLRLNTSGADAICFVIDKSPSMDDDIKEIEKNLDQMLGKIDMTLKPVTIVTYSGSAEVVLENCKDISLVKQALKGIKSKGASEEKLFAAINLGFTTLKKSESPLFVVVTDETGDDAEESLEKTLKTLSRKKSRIHVLTTPASFGNDEWFWSIFNNKQTNQKTVHYKSTNGPASGTQEILFDFFFVQRAYFTKGVLPYNWKRWAVNAGWAPYNLALIAKETKGKVYQIETDTYLLKSDNFDLKKMKLYQPELLKKSDLSRSIKKDIRRKVVHESLEKYYKSRMEMIRSCNFRDPNLPDGEKKKLTLEFLESNSKAVDGNMKLIERMIKNFESTMALYEKNKAKNYVKDDSSPSLRWQANIELNYGLAYVAYYEMLQYKKFVKDTKEGRFKFLGGFSENPEKLFHVPIQRILVVEIFMLPKPISEDKKYAIENGDNMDLFSIAKQCRGKNSLSRLTVEEVGQIAVKILKMIEKNHANTPWAALAEKTKNSLGDYAFLSYVAGRSSNTSGKQ